MPNKTKHLIGFLMDQFLTKEVFKENPYKNKCKSSVVNFQDNWIQLDQTIFYAEGGGQLGDIGFIKTKKRKVEIINTIREGNLIKHITNDDIDLNINDEVECIINWDRRYRLMKMHTCLHLLCSLINAQVTGGSVTDYKGRLDFNLDYKPNKEEVKNNLNDLIQGNYAVTDSWISDTDLDKNPDLVRTMSVAPPRGAGKIRMVKIGDNIDYQPCGGTHVKNTSEIGLVEITKVENKGKLNKRIVVSLV